MNCADSSYQVDLVTIDVNTFQLDQTIPLSSCADSLDSKPTISTYNPLTGDVVIPVLEEGNRIQSIMLKQDFLNPNYVFKRVENQCR